jgi:hypothetical protein
MEMDVNTTSTKRPVAAETLFARSVPAFQKRDGQLLRYLRWQAHRFFFWAVGHGQ